MSVLGPAIVQSVAGLSQAEQVAVRDKDRKKTAEPDRKRRPEDAVDIDVDSVQTTEAVRNLKGNADEETAEDRTEQDHYRAQQRKPKPPAPRLDVQG